MSDFERQPSPVLENVSELIFAEGAQCPSPRVYLTFLERHYTDHKWTPFLKSFAEYIEPIDETFGVDPEQPAATNFYRGNIMGLRVIETAQGTPFLQHVIGAILNTDFAPGEVEPVTRRAAQAELMRSFGDAGLRAGDPNVEIANSWEDQICPDIRVQNYLRSGFGFMLHVSHEIIRIDADLQREADLQVMYNQVHFDGDRDWTAGLGELGL